jgi:hypothetical protein
MNAFFRQYQLILEEFFSRILELTMPALEETQQVINTPNFQRVFSPKFPVGTRYMYVDWFSYTSDTSSPCIATDTCADLNAECGEIDNGCNMVACGACPSGKTCSNKKCVGSSGSGSGSSSSSSSSSSTSTSSTTSTSKSLEI